MKQMTKKKDSPTIFIDPPGPRVRDIIESIESSTETTAMIRGLVSDEPWIAGREEGVWIEDPDGNVFLDFSSFHSVANVGRRNPKVVEACIEQLCSAMTGKVEGNNVYLKLVKRLAEITPGRFGKEVSLGLSGSDANEGSIKLARWHTGRPYVVGFYGAYHGQTQVSMELTTVRSHFRRFYTPIPGIIHISYPYCYRCMFNLEHPGCEFKCLEYLRGSIFGRYVPVDEVAAIIMEPIQGDAGNIVPPDGYLNEVQSICQENGVLLIMDEVQSGMGRTGKMFACEHWDVEPDILVLGKALGAGMPISACVYKGFLTEKDPVLEACFSTTAANPVCCAAALANIEVIKEERLCENAATVGGYVLKRLEEMKKDGNIIGDVRGKGLMIGVEIVKDNETKKPAPDEARLICENAYKKGLALIRYGVHQSVLRIHPPLILTREQADVGLEILESSINEAQRDSM